MSTEKKGFDVDEKGVRCATCNDSGLYWTGIEITRCPACKGASVAGLGAEDAERRHNAFFDGILAHVRGAPTHSK